MVALTPRSKKRERIMREEYAESQKVGVDFSNIQFEVVS